MNKPPHVSEKHLRNGCIIPSAAEMLNFIRGLCFIVEPFVPKEYDRWQLLIKLKTVVEIIFSETIYKSTHMLLDIEITEYLTELSKHYPNHIKPKHHFLIPYPRIMKSIGPLPQISCMRNESKHRDGKVTSHVAICNLHPRNRLSALSLPPALFSSSTVKSSSRRTTQELRSCLWNGSTCGNKFRTIYWT